MYDIFTAPYFLVTSFLVVEEVHHQFVSVTCTITVHDCSNVR